MDPKKLRLFLWREKKKKKKSELSYGALRFRKMGLKMCLKGPNRTGLGRLGLYGPAGHQAKRTDLDL